MSELLERTMENGGVYLVSPQLEMCPRLGHAFFTREGGVSQGAYASMNFRFNSGDSPENVEENFRLAAQVVGGSYERVVRTCQKHTDVVEVVESKEGGFRQIGAPDGCDALITNVPGVVLAGFYADCQLILLFDEHTHSIGLVHSGWRGIEKRILAKTIEKMTALYGTQPRNIIAAVSPSICRRCFETDDDVKEALFEVYQDQVSDYLYREGNKWHIDLRMLTYASLLRMGVPTYNIDFSAICPCCDGNTQRYWSHRRAIRDGVDRGVQGAMITIHPVAE